MPGRSERSRSKSPSRSSQSPSRSRSKSRPPRSRSKSPSRGTSSRVKNRKKPEPSVKQYKALFDRADVDGDGVITAEELHAAMLLEFDVRISKADVMDMMRLADLDGDGVVDFSEFAMLMADLAKRSDLDVGSGLPVDNWGLLLSKVSEGSSTLDAVLKSVRSSVDQNTPAINVLSKSKIVKKATWSTRIFGECIGFIPIIFGLFVFALSQVDADDVPIEYQRKTRSMQNKIRLLNQPFISPVFLASCALVWLWPCIRKCRTWGQIIMGTRLVDAKTFKEVGCVGFFVKMLVRVILCFSVAMIPLVPHLINQVRENQDTSALAIVGSELAQADVDPGSFVFYVLVFSILEVVTIITGDPGSSIADKIVGTCVVVSVKNTMK